MDAFGGLGQFSKKPAQMTLSERQRQAESAKQASQTRQQQQWSGLDSLSSLSSTVPSATPSRASPAPQSLIDDFDVFTSAPPVSGGPVVDPFADFAPAPAMSETQTKSSASNETNLFGDSNGFHSGISGPGSSGSTSRSTYAAPSPRPAQTASKPRSTEYDHAIAQLVDMGFQDTDAARGLDAMGTVKGAINYLMAEAQGKPLPKPKPKKEEDVLALAQDVGAQVFATASSWWSKANKQIQKTLDTYQAGPASTDQPAWMRSQNRHLERESRLEKPGDALPARQRTFDEELPRRRRPETPSSASGGATAASSGPASARASVGASSGAPSAPKSRADLFRERQAQRGSPSSGQSPASSSPAPDFLGGSGAASTTGPGSGAASSAASSAAREVDLLGMSSAAAPPSLSSTQADMMETARASGTDAFKRGDYAGSIVHFSTALQSIPGGHLLRTILLSNRSAALLKEGDSHAALADTAEGLKIIGLDVVRKDNKQEIEPGKYLVDIWVKLQVRKAQAYEHLEKHPEALEAWRLLLDNGHSNNTYLDGKRRCQAAIDQKNRPAAPPAAEPAKKSARRGWGTTGAAPTSAQGKAAVEKVRKLNEDQARSDREREDLLESVTNRINRWKYGKETDLRALLSSLDTVLWPECQWTPVASADLVSPKKARIVYMKAVAKTHPDKISCTASTEVKMISETVFITLNKAWETFKDANGLK